MNRLAVGAPKPGLVGASFLALVLWPFVGHQPACGGLVVAEQNFAGNASNPPINVRVQDAIIFFHSGREAGESHEDLILRITVEGDGSNFAWILPFPATPTIIREDACLFDELKYYTRIRSSRPTGPVGERSSWLGYSQRGTPQLGIPSLAQVRMARRPTHTTRDESLGDFEWTLVPETQAGGVEAWLRQCGYLPLGEEAKKMLAFYRENDYVFVCVKVRGVQLRHAGPVALPPLRFSFATGGRDGIYFPLRLAGLQQNAFDVNLYVFYKAWLNDHVSRFGHDHRGFTLRYRDWDTPACVRNAGKAYSDPRHDPFLRDHADGLAQFSKLCQRLHPGEPYYMTHLTGGSLDPSAVRNWSDELWLFPNYVDPTFVPHDVRPGGPAAHAWPHVLVPEDANPITQFTATYPWLGMVLGYGIAVFCGVTFTLVCIGVKQRKRQATSANTNDNGTTSTSSSSP